MSAEKNLCDCVKLINYDINTTPKSQGFKDIAPLNFAITIIARKTTLERKNVVDHKPRFFKLNVDDLIDFKIAKLLYQELGIGIGIGIGWLMI